MSQRKARGAQGGGAPRRAAPGARPRLYTLQVSLFSGPVAERFVAANPVMARTLQIRGDQTLEDLHRAIFRAFDREEEHLYEFRFGRGPYDPQAPLYVHPVVAAQEAELLGRPPAGVVTQTRLDSLGLRVGRSFGYWFDMGDEWGHQVEVLDIAPEVPPGPFPRVVGRIGASPPQYVDWDAEERDSLATPATGAGPRGRRGTASAEQPPTRFALNPFKDVRCTRCPMCEAAMRLRQVPLALLVADQGLLALTLPCRFCPLDSLLIAHQDVLEARLHHLLGRQVPSGSYRVLGVVRPESRQRRSAVKESPRAIDGKAVQPFHETVELQVEYGGWAPAALR